MRDGTPISIRPIRPDDEPLMVVFHTTLSDQSVYLRYFHQIALTQRVSHERLARVCLNDYDREIALVAVCRDPASGAPAIIAVGRLIKIPGSAAAEFALLISDRYQRCGLGSALMLRLIEVGRAEGLSQIVAEVLPENVGMLRICQQLGFQIRHTLDAVRVSLHL